MLKIQNKKSMGPSLLRGEAKTLPAFIRVRIVNIHGVDTKPRDSVRGIDQSQCFCRTAINILHEAEGRVVLIVEVEVIEEGRARDIGLETIWCRETSGERDKDSDGGESDETHSDRRWQECRTSVASAQPL